MIIYKYTPENLVPDPAEEAWCKAHNIVYYPPSKERQVWLRNWLKNAKLPKIKCPHDVVCYWRSFGVWGMYHPEDNSISICPFEIEKAGGLEETIRHELAHLQHPEANKLTHEQKENYINNLK